MNKKNNIIQCKIILVGESGVGKTSIINRYLDKYTENQKETIGASYAKKVEKIDNYEINLDIWDTAGQEKFRVVNTIFYKEAYICLLVFDITKKETFEKLKEYWYNTVKESADLDIIFGVAGNKIDLYENEEVDENDVLEYCKEINASYYKTSARSNTSIDSTFRDLAKKFMDTDIFKTMAENVNVSIKNKIKLDGNQPIVKKQKSFC